MSLIREGKDKICVAPPGHHCHVTTWKTWRNWRKYWALKRLCLASGYLTHADFGNNCFPPFLTFYIFFFKKYFIILPFQKNPPLSLTTPSVIAFVRNPSSFSCSDSLKSGACHLLFSRSLANDLYCFLPLHRFSKGLVFGGVFPNLRYWLSFSLYSSEMALWWVEAHPSRVCGRVELGLSYSCDISLHTGAHHGDSDSFLPSVKSWPKDGEA